jgi:hypothetical protein
MRKHFYRALSVIALAAIPVILLSQTRGRPPEPWIADVPAEFRLLYAGPGIPINQLADLWAGFPCESISLEFKFEGGGGGSAGNYTVTFQKAVTSPRGDTPDNGSAEIHVVRGGVQSYRIPAAGDYVGNVDVRTFGKLCHLSRQVHFDSLPNAFPIGIGVNFQMADGITNAVSVTEGGKTKRVSDRGFGPVELWALQQAIDSAATRIRWTAK